MKLENINLAIGACSFPLYDLLWGLEQAKAERDLASEVMAAGERFIRSDFAPKQAGKFCELVCIWGRGQRVFANLIRHHGRSLEKTMAAALKEAYNSVDDESAITPLLKIKGLRVSFASKHLRLMLPDRFGVLDSRYCDALGFALNQRGFSFFMKQLRNFAEQVRRHSPNHFAPLPISTIEQGLFYLVQPKNSERLEFEREIWYRQLSILLEQ